MVGIVKIAGGKELLELQELLELPQKKEPYRSE